MAYSYNQATFVGRLVKNPELRIVSNDQAKINFVLAVNRPFKRKDGTTDTDFIPVAIFGRAAEQGMQLLMKGSAVLVWGRVQVRSYEKDNMPRKYTEVVAENFQILDRKKTPPLGSVALPDSEGGTVVESVADLTPHGC
ncbi:MAG: single-strand DNA-binding protein [Candidatus Marinamargulisbacteria bacterium]|jgi:single-strand DNA-binding protein